MDLFDHNRAQLVEKTAPLAARMRPRTLDEFVGQAHIVGPGRLLRRAIQADQLSSLIFHGPPGTGKTTLARIIANTTHAHFISLNAVLSGVKDIRQAIATAEEQLGLFGRKTILFVDEVHRFNKAQQDALLPHVENGTVILIGATTENPYFEVNKALVSRSRIFQLKSLTEETLRQVVYQALADKERGYGKREIDLRPEALNHLVNVANGDARAVLNALELAVETTTPTAEGRTLISLDIAEESIQQRAVLYDKDGDAHFDIISAFIKSLRGSDPDAALYWLSRMLYAGEAPRFIFRRMLVLASEDVGLADPQALGVVTAAAQAFDYVGLPEGRYHLAQACLYLATCPKSNSTLAFFDALTAVEQEREAEVPDHLKDANRDGADFGHGANYLYPHAYRDHWVAQQYLPQALQGQVFYTPSEQGYEASLRTQVLQRREAQLAAVLELSQAETLLGGTAVAGPPAQTRWLQRTLSTTGEQLAHLRTQIFQLAEVARHDVVLDLNAGTGLLTWEAVRRAAVGGVWAVADSERTAHTLRQQAQNLPALSRPVILQGDVRDLPTLIAAHSQAEADSMRFEVLLGRNVLTRHADKLALLRQFRSLLQADGGRLVLAEAIPRHSQRLYQLVDLASLPDGMRQRLIEAEEAIYQQADDPMVNWAWPQVEQWLGEAGFGAVSGLVETQETQVSISQSQFERWFSPASDSTRPSYVQHLAQHLSPAEIEQVQALYQRQLVNQVVTWQTRLGLVLGRVGPHPQPLSHRERGAKFPLPAGEG